MKSLWLSCSALILVWLAPSMAADRIRLSEEMLINLSGQRPAFELVDEQDLAGDPRKGDAQQPKTIYSNGWINARLYYPLSIVVDLGVVHDLTDICYFDVEDQGVLSVDYRDADAWKPLFSGPLSQWRQWTSRSVTARHALSSPDVREPLLTGGGGRALRDGPGRASFNAAAGLA